MSKELEMEINAVGPADVRINIYENCRGGSISILILIGVTIVYTRITCSSAYVPRFRRFRASS